MSTTETDDDLEESFRSKVQYNAEVLEEAGYANRVRGGNRMQPELTAMGELWVAERDADV